MTRAGTFTNTQVGMVRNRPTVVLLDETFDSALTNALVKGFMWNYRLAEVNEWGWAGDALDGGSRGKQSKR